MNRFAIGGPIALGIILMALYAIRQSPYRVSATQSQAQTIPTPGVETNCAYRRLLMKNPSCSSSHLIAPIKRWGRS